MSIPAVRLNHAVLFVTDMARSVRFWTAAFGSLRSRVTQSSAVGFET
jgi:catechol 2,3-dioxygenase-like lactoylglutathione lyase family enzyme